MNSADILKIAQQLRLSGMQSIEIREASLRLRLVARPVATQGTSASTSSALPLAVSDADTVVRSNGLGIARFHHPAQSAGAALFAGAQIEAGTPALYLELGGILKSIESPVSGEIAQLFVVDGEKVDFGKPLFSIKANA